jgi:Skp family chaperone for outer membrane proteins
MTEADKEKIVKEAVPIHQFFWKEKYTVLFVFIFFGTIVGCVAIGLYFGSQQQQRIDDKTLSNVVKQYEDRLGTQSAQHAAELVRYDSKFDKLASKVGSIEDKLDKTTAKRDRAAARAQASIDQAAKQAALASAKTDELTKKVQQSQNVIAAKVDEATSAVKATTEPPPPQSPTDTHWWQKKGH